MLGQLELETEGFTVKKDEIDRAGFTYLSHGRALPRSSAAELRYTEQYILFS